MTRPCQLGPSRVLSQLSLGVCSLCPPEPAGTRSGSLLRLAGPGQGWISRAPQHLLSTAWSQALASPASPTASGPSQECSVLT